MTPRQPVVVVPHRKRPAPKVAPPQMAGHPTPVASPQTVAANSTVNNGEGPTSEIATAFIPLAEGRGLAPADSLQLVRVELPRAALVSFGLPMNVERVDQRVKADLLVGNDGVARAIRFVR